MKQFRLLHSLSFQKMALALLTATVSLSAMAAEYVPKIVCGVVKADSWTMGNNREGIYELEVKEGGQLKALTGERDVYLAPLGGAVYQDGTMYGIHFRQEWDAYEQANTYTIYSVTYDMQTWTRTKAAVLNSMYGNLISSCGITHDPVTGLNYGIFYNFDMSYRVINRKLATIDFQDTEASGAPKKQVIGIVETPFAAIAASENGFLYGVGHDGFLYIIDKETADASSVMVYPLGDLGIEDISTNPSSMTFDPRTKKLYWSYVSTSQKSYLYEINYTIGQVKATRLMQLPDNAYLVNMYIAPMAAGDDAPAAVTALSAQFTGEQTTGQVTFTMPTTSYSGDALSGMLNYTIYADDAVVATGTAEAGARVDRQVTVASDGQDVTLRVTAQNDGGEGAPATTTLYIGRDTPLAVDNLHLSYNPDTEYMRLTWDAPTQGTHGLELTQSNLSYTVVRQPDNVVVAEGLKLMIAFGETIAKTANLKSYYYDVTVVNGSHTSQTASSNKVTVGQALLPPFDENFTTQVGFDRFTVVDSNNDGKSWQRFHKYYTYSGTTVDYAQMTASSLKDDDDYLLTPPLQLEKGGRYALRFTACKGYSDKKYDQKLRVLVGQGDDLGDYEVVMDNVVVDDVNLLTFNTELAIQQDGIYQIAFHAVSAAGSDVLNIDEIHLAASLQSEAPSAATAIEAKADESGLLKATVTFTAPTTTLHGDALTSISRVVVTDEDDHEVGTLTTVTPGQQYTMTLDNLTNGVHTYYITAYVGDTPGAKAEFSLFVGQDYPLQPTAVLLTDNGTDAILSWSAPTVGLNGLPLNPDRLTYNLYTIAADGSTTLLKSNITSPYNTGIKTATGDQQLLYYAIDAANSAGLSELVATNGLVTGAPYTLPYVDIFDKTNQQFVWIEGDYADWNIGLAKISSDGDEDGYAMAFQPNRADFGSYNLGKLSLAGAENPVLSFDYYAMPAAATATLSVLADTRQDGTADVLRTIDYQQETTTEWKHVDIDLSAYKSQPYVILKFFMTSLQSASPQTVIVFDDLRIADKDTDGVADIRRPVAASRGIYRLDGTRIDAADHLPKGIYIIDGRKTIVR